MEHFKFSMAWLAMLALIFTSCSKEESDSIAPDDVATLTFGTALQGFNSATNKQQDVEECVEGDPAIAQIVLEYGGMEHEVFVSILGDEDGGYFTAFSEDLEIPVPAGSDYVMVELTDFVVWTDDDDDGEADRVLWVAPKAGSDYAQFVTNPLGGDDAYTWNLRAGSKTYTDVEVLCFDNRDVNRYGYQFFDIIATELQTFCVFANYCTPNGKHYTANYSLDLYTFTGTPSQVRPTLDNSYNSIYSDEMPDPATMGDENGNYYADPLCLSVPMLDEGEYLYYEATIANWDGNYNDPDNYMVWGYVSQADIDALVTADGDNNPETMDYLHLFFNCGNTPPPSGDCPAGTDPDGDGLCNPDDDCPDTHVDNDADGDCDADNDDPCPYDPDNNCDGNEIPEGCETAYMFGDYELADLGLKGGKNWGWGLVIDADDIAAEVDGVWEIPFYAGAGQNDYENNGYQAGYIILTLDKAEGTLAVTFDLEDDVTRNDTHIWVSSGWPTSRAPGQFDMDDDDDVYPIGDGDIYVIVHAEVCGDGDDD